MSMEFITKADYAYASLRSDIVNGVLESGEKLQLINLAKRYGVSTVPLRSALVKLEEQGLVTTIPHVGAYVTTHNIGDYFPLMLLRLEAEASATLIATISANEEQLDEIDRLTKRMEYAFCDEGAEEYANNNRKVHEAVYSCCNDQIIQTHIANLMERTKFAKQTFELLPSTMKTSLLEHKLWAKAIRERDIAKSISIIRFQRSRSCLNLLEFLIANSDSDNPRIKAILKGNQDDLFRRYIKVFAYKLRKNFPQEMRELNPDLLKYLD